MKAKAVVVAEQIDGRTRLTELHSEAPLLVRPTPGGVHLVGGAAGPLGGDVLEIDVEVGPGATLAVRSSAASICLPGTDPTASELRVVARVHAGATLRWTPEPLVSVVGSDHRATFSAELAADAHLLVEERVVLGRSGEPPGRLHLRLDIVRAGVALVRSESDHGTRWPGGPGPGGMAGVRDVTTVVAVGPHVVADLADGWPIGPDAAMAVRLGARRDGPGGWPGRGGAPDPGRAADIGARRGSPGGAGGGGGLAP